LQDLTPRAAESFKAVDFIAAEDTRVTLKLLNYLGLKKPMVSYYEHNAAGRGKKILARIAAGESCALCSDAGVPAISDPGEALVAEAHAMGIKVVPVPAANAAVTALCASGQSTARFVFEGFLPQNRHQRGQRLQALQGEERTVLFYEAPHKLPQTLRDLQEAFGSDRPLSVCRELTKLHEEIVVTTVGEACHLYEAEKPRGEFVLVMAGAPAEEEPGWTLQQATDWAKELAAGGLSASEAAKQAAARSGHSKSEIYRQMIKGH
jgi:16S rRNA (cytidine1402-2'-O)-methyltransferase